MKNNIIKNQEQHICYLHLKQEDSDKYICTKCNKVLVRFKIIIKL